MPEVGLLAIWPHGNWDGQRLISHYTTDVEEYLGGWCSTGVLRAVVIDSVSVSGSDRWVWLVNVLACIGFRDLCESLVGAHSAGGRVWESHLTLAGSDRGYRPSGL